MAFRDVKEGELEKGLGEHREISVSGTTKQGGYCDPSKVLYEWNRNINTLPDLQLGAYLTIWSGVNMAIENANTHGGDDLALSMQYSDRGISVCVADSGPGFNVRDILNRFNTGQKHYKFAGQGFSSMAESPAIVYFNEQGNKTFLGYLIEDKERKDLIERAKSNHKIHLKMSKLTRANYTDYNSYR